MILDIKTFPDEILRKKAQPVEKLDDETLKLIEDMAETMYKAPGLGLAAPQVGVSKRIIVADEFVGQENSKVRVFINPEILEMSGELLEEEGCLSIPGEYAFVKRYKNVKLKFLDKDFKENIIEATDNLARIIQHEFDHLEGRLFIDKLPLMKRETIKKHIKRRIQAGDYNNKNI